MNPVLDRALMFEQPDHAVIATDAAGFILHWDAGAERIYGWARAEVLGRNIVDVTPSEMTRAKAEEIMAALRAGREYSGDFVVRDRSGRRFEANVTDVPVRDADGRVLGMIGISRRLERVPQPRSMPQLIG